MVVHKAAIPLIIVSGAIFFGVGNNFMRMIAMMDVLDHGCSRLVMPRLMRTPCHARYDQRAD